MLGDETLQIALLRFGKGIVSGAEIGKLRPAAHRWNGAGIKQRRESRGRAEGTVGVPQPIAHLVQPAGAVGVPDFIALGQVGDIGNLGGYAELRARTVFLDRGLQRAEPPGKAQVLFGAEVLIGKDQHAVGPKGLFDLVQVHFGDRLGQIDIAHLGGKTRSDRIDDQI